VCDQETGLYVPVGDPAALAEAVSRLLVDPTLARSFGANALRVVEQDLNLDTYLASMVELVCKVQSARSSKKAADKQTTALQRVMR
jgi:glycosyltransferase involved in cell wall biosynthesis